MKFPEKWEQPNWHLPINFPLLEETYFFSGLVDENTIYLDSDSTLYVFFKEEELKNPDGDYVGIDSDFSQYFQINGLEPPDPFIVGYDPIEIGGLDESFIISKNLSELGDSLVDCFSDNILDTFQDGELVDSFFYQVIYNEDDIDAFESIDSIRVTDGLFKVEISNEFPFEITRMIIEMYTGDESILWSPEINNISAGETLERQRIISEIEPVIIKRYIRLNYSVIIDPQTGSDECLGGTGWDLNDDYNRFLNITFDLNFEEIGLISGQLDEFDFTKNYQIHIPESDDISISGGLLSYSNEENEINQLNLEFSNNLPADLVIDFKILELYKCDEYDQDCTIEYEWNKTLQKDSSALDILDLSHHMLKPIDSDDGNLENLNLVFSGLIPSQYIDLNPNIPYSFEIDEVLIKPIKFEYINAIFDTMEFSSPSIQIDDVPEGFEGFKFADVRIDLNIYNEIGIPIYLDMYLAGVNNGDTTKVPLQDTLFSPLVSSGFDIGDIVHTNIVMDGTHQYSTWYYEDNIFRQDTVELSSSFLDVMNFAPSEIIVGGDTKLNGYGTLALDTYINGDFELNLPLSFIFEDQINIVPNVTTELQPMNDGSKQQIDNGLVSANLHVNIENHSSLAMVISLLISTKEDYFPHYLDDLISGSLVTNQTFIEDNSENDFDMLSSLNVSRIQVENLSDNEDKALRVIFRDENLNVLFWVGRIADITIPEADDINLSTGHVVSSGYGEDVIELSAEKMEWLTTGEKRYSRPMIEFIALGEDPRTIRSTDYLKISSYISIVLDTGGI